MPHTLTDNQRYVLQQIRDLNGQAYLSTIKRRVKEVTGKDISLGRMGDILLKMELRQWVKSEIARAEIEQGFNGGRRGKVERPIKLYEILPGGMGMLGG